MRAVACVCRYAMMMSDEMKIYHLLVGASTVDIVPLGMSDFDS